MRRYFKQLGLCLLALGMGILFTQCEKDQLPNKENDGGDTNSSLPVVSTNNVTNITSSSAYCGGNVTSDGGSTVTTRGVCWGTSQNPTVNNSRTSNGSGTGSFNTTLTGLMSGTTYYVRAYATNSYGTSYGAQKSFTTQTSGVVLLQESFENGIPSSWNIFDNDGDGYNWDSSMPFDGHSGKCVSSASYINDVGPLTPENWLITPSVYLSGGANLTFWVAAQDASYPAEHYGVFIKSSSSDSYTKLFEETMNANGGLKEQGVWKQKSINLSAYTGQTVRIAFVHFNCTDGYWLNLDEVKIVK